MLDKNANYGLGWPLSRQYTHRHIDPTGMGLIMSVSVPMSLFIHVNWLQLLSLGSLLVARANGAFQAPRYAHQACTWHQHTEYFWVYLKSVQRTIKFGKQRC